MNAAAREALAIIRCCFQAERVVATKHFLRRMGQRALFLPDVLAVVDDPAEATYDGFDEYRRPKWLVAGKAADGTGVTTVCVLDMRPTGHWTKLITIYWD
jgi:hypothetical protein